MAQNNNEIMNAVYKYCSDYGYSKIAAKGLTGLFEKVGAPPTKAQIKLIFEKAAGFTASGPRTGAYRPDPVHRSALIRALKLKEPCFLRTLFDVFINDTDLRTCLISKYLYVCTDEAARNALKSITAYNVCADRLEKAYVTRLNEVYEYAMYHASYDEPFYISNAYQAAWYVLSDDRPDVELTADSFSGKQLKEAMANIQAIDRYAMIVHRDYDEVIAEQCELLHEVKLTLFEVGAQIHVFKNSTELAEEGIRMRNCIATYWDHDSTSCLFSVDYKGQHMDVELERDSDTEWEKWDVEQVLLAGNTETEITKEIKHILENVCCKYTAECKDFWRETYEPNKNICRQMCNRCDLCINKTCCPASPYFGADEEIDCPANPYFGADEDDI